MDNLFVGQPGMRELRLKISNERYYPANLKHIRRCIRNYKYIKSLRCLISKSRLSCISKFYKTKADFEEFKMIYFLERKIQMKKLVKFKHKSQDILRRHIHNTNTFYNSLGRKLACHSAKLNTFSDLNDILSESPRHHDNSNQNLHNSVVVTHQEIQKDSAVEAFFTDTYSDLSDHTDINKNETQLRNIFFTGDLFLKDIGDNELYFKDIGKDKMKDGNSRKITINLKIKKNPEEKAGKLTSENRIVFANESLFDNTDTSSLKNSSILNQNPNSQPKNINFDSFICQESDQVNFDFKKVPATKQKNVLKKQVLASKDVNRQKQDDCKNYEKILKKNTTLNSNYKFIKVHYTNIMPKRISIGQYKRERKVKFAEDCTIEPHNTNSLTPILVKSQFKTKIKSAKVKQTVFIKRLV